MGAAVIHASAATGATGLDSAAARAATTTRGHAQAHPRAGAQARACAGTQAGA